MGGLVSASLWWILDFRARLKGFPNLSFQLRTFESNATEHIIYADKLVLAPNFYYSLATVCYVLTKISNF